jgi:RNA polymerase sigma-70 factor (ECF subfamily)
VVSSESTETLLSEVDAIYRRESTRVLATLIRLLGNFDLAEDSMQAAFASAVEQWPKEGIPNNPRAWLVSTGRFKAIDAIRREKRLFASMCEAVALPESELTLFEAYDENVIEDDRLRLLFTCCHPVLSFEGQVALTLRDVCGLRTEEIARAFLCPSATIAQRIVRAKAKIREECVRYEVPPMLELHHRTQSVLQVTYLLFNEGYYASSGKELIKGDLSGEAIRLGRLLAELLPEPEVLGLLALMLLQESRREARVTSSGDIVLMPDQDSSRWDTAMIEEGLQLCDRASESKPCGTYALQAAIAAAHVKGALAHNTDWRQIVELYDQLLAQQSSPIVELNRSVAVSMSEGPSAGLAILDRLFDSGELAEYGLAHATKADFCRRLGKLEQAKSAYLRALKLSDQQSERRFLEERLREVSNG